MEMGTGVGLLSDNDAVRDDDEDGSWDGHLSSSNTQMDHVAVEYGRRRGFMLT